MKEIRYRCWINVDEEKYFGPGPLRLLELIDQEGSLSKASKAMGMSYKKAWDIISNLNEKATDPLVITKKGGAKGGGAEITTRGRALIDAYKLLNTKIEVVIKANDEILGLI